MSLATSGHDRIHIDHGALADFRLAEARHTSSCSGCGSPEPVRIEGTTCSECTSYPKCAFCSRWVGDGSGSLPGYVNALDAQGEDIRVCLVCLETTE